MLSNEQFTTGNEIIGKFNNIRWIILTAQMQSGKTGTYYFVAAEMLRQKSVDNVVIFSGNTELELKHQTQAYKKTFLSIPYRKYLIDNI